MKTRIAQSKDKIVKITVPLTKSSVDFFKYLAKKRKANYQEMMSDFLNRYAQSH